MVQEVGEGLSTHAVVTPVQVSILRVPQTLDTPPLPFRTHGVQTNPHFPVYDRTGQFTVPRVAVFGSGGDPVTVGNRERVTDLSS